MGRSNDFYREWLLDRLRHAEARVIQAGKFLERQREFSKWNGWRPQDTELRKKLLATMEELQEMRIAERNRLLAELNQLSDDPD